MIALNALYDFTEALIANSQVGDPLYEAGSARNLREPVNQTAKTVRVDCSQYELAMESDERNRERKVQGTIQLYCLPDDTSLAALDDALIVADEMAWQIFTAMVADPSLSGGVCDAQIQKLRRGTANLGTTLYGGTYLDVLINQAG